MKPRKKKDEIEEIPQPNETETPTDKQIENHIKQIHEEKEQIRKIIRTTPLGDKNLMQMGRILGVIQRTHPHVLQILKEESARTGKKEYEILRDWIVNYSILRYDTWNKMSVAELYEAWQILNEFQTKAVENFGKFAKIMFSTQMQTFTDIIQEATKQKSGYSPEAKERALHKLIDSFEPLIDIFSTLMTKNMQKLLGINTTQTPKIPVTIQYEEQK